MTGQARRLGTHMLRRLRQAQRLLWWGDGTPALQHQVQRARVQAAAAAAGISSGGVRRLAVAALAAKLAIHSSDSMAAQQVSSLGATGSERHMSKQLMAPPTDVCMLNSLQRRAGWVGVRSAARRRVWVRMGTAIGRG
jgi:hypothetical protein